MVRVLIVDDSAFARLSISKQLSTDLEIEVVGFATDGIEALEKIGELKPDVITLDVEMPRMGGLKALEHIMAKDPTPVVMLSSLTDKGSETTIRALELGAIDFFLKGSRATSTGYYGLNNNLNTKIRLAALVERTKLKRATKRKEIRRRPERLRNKYSNSSNRVVVIGSSTGGPTALYELIPNLPDDIPASMLVVQHMPPVFTKSLADRLNQLSQIEVKEAEIGDCLKAGQVLLAPGDYHMTVETEGRVRLDQGPPVLGLRPSVDVTMRSVAQVYGNLSIGVVLTGMGADGTKGAASIKAAGGKVTAQDEATCVVYGMPRSVVESGNVDKILPLSRISRELILMCQE
ncbi:MAG: chemotaxis response regulator protein-glutamate methylesterase [Dehalococcoidales bacterium]